MIDDIDNQQLPIGKTIIEDEKLSIENSMQTSQEMSNDDPLSCGEEEDTAGRQLDLMNELYVLPFSTNLLVYLNQWFWKIQLSFQKKESY